MFKRRLSCMVNVFLCRLARNSFIIDSPIWSWNIFVLSKKPFIVIAPQNVKTRQKYLKTLQMCPWLYHHSFHKTHTSLCFLFQDVIVLLGFWNPWLWLCILKEMDSYVIFEVLMAVKMWLLGLLDYKTMWTYM